VAGHVIGFKNGTVVDFTPVEKAEYMSEYTGRPAALWYVRYDNLDIEDEELEQVEVEDAVNAFANNYYQGKVEEIILIELEDLRLPTALLDNIGNFRDKLLLFSLDSMSQRFLNVDNSVDVDGVVNLDIQAMRADLRFICSGTFNGQEFNRLVQQLNIQCFDIYGFSTLKTTYIRLVQEIAATLE